MTRRLCLGSLLVAVALHASLLHSEEPTRGTINILLANANGMVLVTDSRASGTVPVFHVVNNRSHKLFQIDSTTVCSIAGFGTDPGPHGTMRETVGGDISRITIELAKGAIKLSFQEKVSSIVAAVAIRLTQLEDAYDYAAKSQPPRPQPQPLIMLFAGFDRDGSAKIAKATISISSVVQIFGSHQIFGSNVDMKVTDIENNFVYLTSGIDDSAQSRLKAPMAFQDEKELGEYGRAVRDGRTSALGLDQLERLAVYLENDASHTSEAIGGHPQVATLTGGRVLVKLPNDLLADDPKSYTSGFVTYNRFSDDSFPQIGTSERTVYLSDYCDKATIVLDYAALIGGKYTNCDFYFDGSDFYRDPNVEISGGKLVFGPHVPMSGYFFDKAHSAIPELTPVSYKDMPNGEAIAKQIWPVN